MGVEQMLTLQGILLWIFNIIFSSHKNHKKCLPLWFTFYIKLTFLIPKQASGPRFDLQGHFYGHYFLLKMLGNCKIDIFCFQGQFYGYISENG